MKTIAQYITAFICLTSFALLWPRDAYAQEPVTLTDEQDSYPLGLHVATLQDPSGELTLEQVMSPEYAAQFVPSHEETPDFGFRTTGWVRLQVNNQSHQTWRLVYAFVNIQELDYYVIDAPQTVLEHVATGSARPFAQRQIPHHYFVFAPIFQPNKIYTIYLRLQGHYFVPVPLTMQSLAAWAATNSSENLLYGLFFGALFIMLGYNMVLFLFLREVSYLYYVTFLAFFILNHSEGFGVYLWPDSVWWSYYRVTIGSTGNSVCALLFTHHFLALKTNFLRLSRLIYFQVGFITLGNLAFIFDITYLLGTPTLIVLILAPVTILGVAFWVWFQGYRAARYLLLAWAVYAVAQVIGLLPRVGLLPLSRVTEHGSQVGVVFMVLLLSIALADRINLLKAAMAEANYSLMVSEHKFRGLFENSKDAIIVSNLSGQVLEANIAALQLFGYPREQNVAHIDLLTHYVQPADREHLQAALQHAGYLKDYELKFRRRDGTLFDAVITATLQQTNGLYIQTILRDITHRKRAEQERLKLAAMQQEFKLAGEVQAKFLPPARPTWPELEVICFTQPTKEIGRDFYDYQRLVEGYSLVVGDISGKGMPAAMLVGVSMAALQTINPQELSPTELLNQLDQTLFTYTQKSRQNCAMCYVELNPLPRQQYYLRVANAGCVTPIIKRCDGSVEWVDVGGMPLGTGFSQSWPYQQLELILTKGDIIILTTDGVVEANNVTNEMYGFPRLEATVKAAPMASAEAMLEYLKHDLMTFVGQAEPHDDITIMVVQL